MKGFWNDSDGLTVIEISAIVLTVGTIAAMIRWGHLDANYADVTLGALLGAAGQHVGVKFARKKLDIGEDNKNE